MGPRCSRCPRLLPYPPDARIHSEMRFITVSFFFSLAELEEGAYWQDMTFPRHACLTLFTFIAVVLMFGGCSKYQGSDITEKDHPKLVAARELVKVQDLEGAEALLLNFLYKHPDYALTHLQLGMLYQSMNAPVKALYHFEKYLEARPNTEKAVIIEQVVEDERRRLAATAPAPRVNLIEDSPELQLQELQVKLAVTEQRLAETQVRLQQAELKQGTVSRQAPPEWAKEKLALLEEIQRLKSVPAQPVAVSTPVPPAAEKRYTVQRGDTLSRISQKVYGEASQWRKIYDANRDRIPNQNALKLGTELVIP